MCVSNLAISQTAKLLPDTAAEIDSVDEHIAGRLLGHPRLKRLLSYIELHPSEWLTTSAAANVACFQKNYFCAFFKRETGCTFVAWQHAWRVTRIAEMLLREDISITRAAERYGYMNMRGFERAFKSVFQISAREFRRKYAAGSNQEPGARRLERHVVRCGSRSCPIHVELREQQEDQQAVGEELLPEQINACLERVMVDEAEASETTSR